MRPNLILITVECWRSDYFGEMTPQMVSIGKESTYFSCSYAAGGWTLPSMTALMSSAYASMFGGPRTALETPERQVLAERLLSAGYWTAGFSANNICGSLNGFHRGFGRFRDMVRALSPEHQKLADEKRNWLKIAEMGISPRSLDRLCEAEQLTNAGLEWIDAVKPGQPYFLWLHYMEPHWPCLTPNTPVDEKQLFDEWRDRHVFRTEAVPRRGRYDPGEDARRRWVKRYSQALVSADREIGRLLSAVHARNDWDRTIVAITGDHGEEFYEHGTWHHAWNNLYREGLQVPLIIRVPAATPVTIAQPVSGIDIAPTLLDYADVPQQSGVKPMMGRSLRPFIEGGEAAVPGRPVYSEMLAHPNSPSYLLAIADGEWRYIYDMDEPDHSRLFHVLRDPGEADNQREQQSRIFRRFETMRFTHVSLGLIQMMKDHAMSASRFVLDPLVRDQMIALGYMVD